MILKTIYHLEKKKILDMSNQHHTSGEWLKFLEGSFPQF
jgi:hypothetical protein